MGGLIENIVGGGGSKSKVQDATPAEFDALRNPLVQHILAFLGITEPVTGVQRRPGEKDIEVTINPFEGDPLAGIPAAPGDLLTPAALSDEELGLIARLQPRGGSGLLQRQNALTAAMKPDPAYSSGGGQYARPGQRYESSGDNPFAVGSEGAYLDQFGFGDQYLASHQFGTDNPYLARMIEAAQRPTIQALEETLSRTLPGRFTQAGQFVQPQGSSAFDRAAAIASRGAGDTMGDIAGRLSFDTYEAERAREVAAREAERGRQVAMMDAERSRQFGAFESERGREHATYQQERAFGQATFEAERNRKFEAMMADKDRQLAAVKLSQGEVDVALKSLQASALPRMLQQMEKDTALTEFRRRTDQFLALMQTILTGTAATPAVTTKSSTTSGFLPVVGDLMKAGASLQNSEP
jgi:hypothetical protein